MSHVCIIFRRSPETNFPGDAGVNFSAKAKYPLPFHIHCSLFHHGTERADEIDTPWSDLQFIVILIIINHLNTLAELTL